MKGEVKIAVKNRNVSFNFTLERNITILTGDSGTGKTKLINMIRDYSQFGKASGVTLKCEKPCLVLAGNNWELELKQTQESIVFVEESSSFLNLYEFAKAIQDSDNYYVLKFHTVLILFIRSTERKIPKNLLLKKYIKVCPKGIFQIFHMMSLLWRIVSQDFNFSKRQQKIIHLSASLLAEKAELSDF